MKRREATGDSRLIRCGLVCGMLLIVAGLFFVMMKSYGPLVRASSIYSEHR